MDIKAGDCSVSVHINEFELFLQIIKIVTKSTHEGTEIKASALFSHRCNRKIGQTPGERKSVRRRVKEVTCDLSPSMMLIAAEVFHSAHVVNDRFHVQQVYNEAVDEIRVDIRRQLIADDNARDRSEPPVTYSNGETMRRILARSKHTLMMAQNKWTDIQRHRANILFRHYPILKDAYRLAMELRRIFNLKISPTKAMGKNMLRQSSTTFVGEPPTPMPKHSIPKLKYSVHRCGESVTVISSSSASSSYTPEFLTLHSLCFNKCTGISA